jgi:hypothetical protein
MIFFSGKMKNTQWFEFKYIKVFSCPLFVAFDNKQLFFLFFVSLSPMSYSLRCKCSCLSFLVPITILLLLSPIFLLQYYSLFYFGPMYCWTNGCVFQFPIFTHFIYLLKPCKFLIIKHTTYLRNVLMY